MEVRGWGGEGGVLSKLNNNNKQTNKQIFFFSAEGEGTGERDKDIVTHLKIVCVLFSAGRGGCKK